MERTIIEIVCIVCAFGAGVYLGRDVERQHVLRIADAVLRDVPAGARAIRALLIRIRES